MVSGSQIRLVQVVANRAAAFHICMVTRKAAAARVTGSAPLIVAADTSCRAADRALLAPCASLNSQVMFISRNPTNSSGCESCREPFGVDLRVLNELRARVSEIRNAVPGVVSGPGSAVGSWKASHGCFKPQKPSIGAFELSLCDRPTSSKTRVDTLRRG